MKKLGLFSFMLLLFNCYFIPCDFESNIEEIGNKKEKSFFIGKYAIEQKFNNSYDNSKALITLLKNGNLEISNLSSKTFYPYRRKENIISAKGYWKLVYIESKKEHRLSLSVKFQKRDSIEDLGLSSKFYLKRNKPIILFEIGDPDECKAIRFMKK
jgi:hypothetical protein